jgi:hypothetical protein
VNQLYGKSESDRRAEENQVARQIVSEIGNFGVNERQRVLIMYLLAMELENVENLKAFTSIIKERCGKDVFLSDGEEPDGSIDR